MAPQDSHRDSGPAGHTATEASHVLSDNPTPTTTPDPDTKASAEAKKCSKLKHKKKHSKTKSGKSKPSKKLDVLESDSDSSSDSDLSSSDDSDEDVSDSESEIEVKKSKKKTLKSKKKVRKGKKSRLPHGESEIDETSELSSETKEDGDVAEDDADSEEDGQDGRQGKQQVDALQLQQLQQLSQLLQQGQQRAAASNSVGLVPGNPGQAIQPDASQIQGFLQSPFVKQVYGAQLGQLLQATPGQVGDLAPKGNGLARRKAVAGGGTRQDKKGEIEKGPSNGEVEFKRVDQVWDSTIHNYKLKDTTQSDATSKYEGFVFHVRRTFDWEGKYKTTYVDIKSKALRECLQEVIGNVKGLSLVEEAPKLDPNMLFLYLDDFRAHLKVLKKTKASGATKKDRKREEKHLVVKRSHLKLLVEYLKEDYAEVKKSLYPMLENGLITFDLIWALWKPGTLVYSGTYGSNDEPRAFKVDTAEKHSSMIRGDFYWVEGKYFEYDGKQFGYGTTSIDIPDFQGARKITSLPCFPLKYHKNEAQLRETLIERGKKFTQLGGVHFKSHQGMAFFKKKKAVVKVNINGRVMVDPAIHRRINPNYQVSIVRAKDHDTELSDGEDSGEDGGGCGCNSGSEEGEGGAGTGDEKEERSKYVVRMVKARNGKTLRVRVPVEEAENGSGEKIDAVAPKDGDSDTKVNTEEASEHTEEPETPTTPVFSDEDYLISSPVVLGFAFSEKLWLEFTVSGIKNIQWNEGAYESLVLEPKTKDIVKALVESHKYHAAESIDDVIQGKGKGLVAVLHGPPGTGKTLTAEGISELLKCPLYMASAGELGTDSRLLEGELQKILDICHAWGAILLLDEADVFLEKRTVHDIHRNALVSIFLRQLEYFQGILFLTTNRVETFDDAFQSRIHIALRYDSLDQKAKKAIFKIFIERVRVLEKADLMPFTEEDYTNLAKYDLNGRQIKNTVRTAQALAVNKGEPLDMGHIRQVLDVLVSFDRDLKGGTGYQEAMRSYF
ncbi:related to TOB3 (member of AAA-ATPase family) [Cephalotrichum gorgonifer]|uniref:Related to TOB3 (Member of AAA-ATPase family) n=1 Tax=Cephalotrichum gorgonifer TaxID=2041049 RepID=A0AAE8SUA7_9PEZI|nr:related to TOB3 (member of AAA-ATPase family) [Cephalotrichum gorgonifer]